GGALQKHGDGSGDERDDVEAEAERSGGEEAVAPADPIEFGLDARSLRLEPRGQGREGDSRGDPVLVAHRGRVDAVAQCLLVAEGEAGDAGEDRKSVV